MGLGEVNEALDEDGLNDDDDDHKTKRKKNKTKSTVDVDVVVHSELCVHAALRPFRIGSALEPQRVPLVTSDGGTTSKAATAGPTSGSHNDKEEGSSSSSTPIRLKWQRCALCLEGAAAAPASASPANDPQPENDSAAAKSRKNHTTTTRRSSPETVPLGDLYVCAACGFVSCSEHVAFHDADKDDGSGGDLHSLFLNVQTLRSYCAKGCLGVLPPSPTVVASGPRKRQGPNRSTDSNDSDGEERSSESDSAKDGAEEQEDVPVAPAGSTSTSTFKPSVDALAVLKQSREVIRDAYSPVGEDPLSAVHNNKPDAKNAFFAFLARGASSVATGMKSAAVPDAKGLVGLDNLGNTCFFNATMQCLLQSQPFSDLLCSPVEDPSKLGDLTAAMHELFSQAWQTSKAKESSRVLAPSDVFSNVSKMNPRFKGFRQQDAHELLVTLLEGMRLENAGMDLEDLAPPPTGLSKFLKLFSSRKPRAERGADESNANVVDRSFLGKARSILTCSVCGNTSVTPEEILVLSLPLPSLYSNKEFQEQLRARRAAAASVVQGKEPPSGWKKKWLQFIGAIPKDSPAEPERDTSDDPDFDARESLNLGGDDISSKDPVEVDGVSVLGGERSSRDAKADVTMSDMETSASAEDEIRPVAGVREHRRASDEALLDDLQCSESESASEDDDDDKEWVLDATHRVSVNDALERFVAIEILDGINSVGCEKCSELLREQDRASELRRIMKVQISAMDRHTKFMRARAGRMRELEQQRRAQANPLLYVKSAFASKAQPPPDPSLSMRERVDIAIERKLPVLRPMTKRIQVCKLAPVLVIQLKRFQLRSGLFVKNPRPVEFSLTLDVSEVLEPEKGDASAADSVTDGKSADSKLPKVDNLFGSPATIYNLFGVVVHMGGMGGGHYIACRKVGRKWYRISDHSVKAMSEAEVLSSEAYLLWYQRAGSI